MQQEKTLPLGIEREANEAARRFEPYRHVRRYINDCRRRNLPDIATTAELLGYQNLNKLRRRMDQWCDLRRPMPKAFTDLIRLDFGLLDEALALDRKEFDEAAPDIIRLPSHFLHQPISFVILERPLPEDCTLDEAVEIVRVELTHPRSVGYIELNARRTLVIFRNGGDYEMTSELGYTHEKGMLTFAPLARRPGLYLR